MQKNEDEVQTSAKGSHKDRTGTQKKENETRKDRKEVQKTKKMREKGKGAKKHKEELIDITDDEIRFSVSGVRQTDGVNKTVDEGSEVPTKVTEIEDAAETIEMACKERRMIESKEADENNKSVSSVDCKREVSAKGNQSKIYSQENGKGLANKGREKDASGKDNYCNVAEKDVFSKDAIPLESENSADQEEAKKENCFEVKGCSVALASNLDIKKIVDSDKCQQSEVYRSGSGKKIDAKTASKLDAGTGENSDIPDDKVYSSATEKETGLNSASKHETVAEQNIDIHGNEKESPARKKKTKTKPLKRRHSTRLCIRPVETLNDVGESSQGKDQAKDISVTDDKPEEEIKPREEVPIVMKPASIAKRRRSSRFSLPEANIESGIKLKELDKVKEEIAALVGEKERSSGCDKKEDESMQIVKKKRGRPRKVPLEVGEFTKIYSSVTCSISRNQGMALFATRQI